MVNMLIGSDLMTPHQQHEIRNALLCCKFLLKRLKKEANPNCFHLIDQIETQLLRISNALEEENGNDFQKN